MGAKNAEASVKSALEEWEPGRVITSGFAGGLNPGLSTGAVVFDADEDFGSANEWGNSDAKPGRFHCADRVAVDPEEKSKLLEATGADAVEMESGVIRRICSELSIPSATVRVISDAADESLPLDFNRLMKADISLDYGRLAWALMKAPGKIPELIRFQKRVNQAAKNLADVLSKALEMNAPT